MKKAFSKFFSTFLALVTLLSIVVPGTSALATGVATPPAATDVVITKIGLDTLEGWPKGAGEDDYTGAQIDDMAGYFGTHTLMEGVAFRVYQGTDATGTEVAGGPFLTDVNGQVRIPNLPAGNYFFVEDKAASTYNNDGAILNEAAAVPFSLTLPMIKADGTYFGTGADALYVYPKNTDEKPTIDKDFTDATTPDATRDYTVGDTVGDTVPYTVTTTVPAKAQYKTLSWGDRMTEGLTYNQDVALTATDGAGAPIAFTPGTDFTVVNTAQGFDLDFTQAGLDKLALATANGAVTFNLNYTATLNDAAIVEVTEKNHVTLKYGNAPKAGNTPVIVKPEEDHITVTKTWAGGTAPAGVTATFDLYNAQTGELVATLIWSGTPVTFTGLDKDTEYRVVERHITGYAPEYSSNANGQVTINNVKDTNPGPLEPETPEVITYGKKFRKVDDNLTTPNPLAGAEFVVKNAAGQYLNLKDTATQAAELAAYQAAEAAYQAAVKAATTDNPDTANIAALKATRDAAYEAVNMQWTWGAKDTAFKFVSAQDGTFEVTGLKAGNYQLEETKAPEGFALITNPIDFTVDAGTYQNVQDVVNKKVTIPQTGGIGTIIFAVVGLSLMAVAVIAYRRSEQAA